MKAKNPTPQAPAPGPTAPAAPPGAIPDALPAQDPTPPALPAAAESPPAVPAAPPAEGPAASAAPPAPDAAAGPPAAHWRPGGIQLLAAHGRDVELVLKLVLPAQEAAALVAAGEQRHQELRQRVEQRARESAEFAAFLAAEQQIRDTEREHRRLTRSLEDVGDSRREVAGDLTLPGPAKAKKLADLDREEAAARTQVADLDAGLAAMQGAADRLKRAVADRALQVAEHAKREALADVAQVEATLAGIPARVADRLGQLVIAGIMGGNLRCGAWSQDAANLVVVALLGELPPPAPPPAAPACQPAMPPGFVPGFRGFLGGNR